MIEVIFHWGYDQHGAVEADETVSVGGQSIAAGDWAARADELGDAGIVDTARGAVLVTLVRREAPVA
jgi:hypothetical protein